jgi:hypothetical protein
VPAPELPSIARVVGGLIGAVPKGRRPLFVALAERLAAERYRRWAGAATEPVRSGLLACAAREDEIASRVAALYGEAAALEREIQAAHPELDRVYELLFAGRPLAEQLTIQAAGERAGAVAWRTFAEQAAGEPARATFLECALLEEASAAYVESLLGPA